MKYIKNYEKYNSNKLNDLIVKYYNDYSESIIEIIDSYEKESDVKNILHKISFIIESSGDVAEIEKNGEILAYYIETKDETENSFFFNTETKKFSITTYKKFMDSLEK